MTVRWETERDGTHYSVRSHGASLRLYSNGVFHSQWNPDRPFAGGVWDCLGLPVLYRAPDRVRRVLLLGVGGGAVIRQLERLAPDARVTGVEIDPVHLDVARRWFGVAEPTATLIEADAIGWLRGYAGEPFDVVIDDLFGHDDGEPLRAHALTPDWIATLRGAVTSDGIVVVNCVDGRELKTAAPAFVDDGFEHGRRWSQPGYENAIGVFARGSLVPREWSRRLEALGLDASAQRRARAIVRRPLRT